MSACFKFDILPIIGQKVDESLLVKGIPLIFQINLNISGKSLDRREERIAMVMVWKLQNRSCSSGQVSYQ
jgi:hypothetical protein